MLKNFKRLLKNFKTFLKNFKLIVKIFQEIVKKFQEIVKKFQELVKIFQEILQKFQDLCSINVCYFKYMAINISKTAATQMLKLSKDLFFYCRSGGCNGFEYVLESCSSKPESSETQTLENGVQLHTCNTSMFHLLGTEIDWKEDIMGSRFTFENPNAKSICGCGITFST